MGKFDKPAWIKTFEDTYSAPFIPGYWNKAHESGKTQTNGTYRSANGARGDHSETSSLYSRYTSFSDRSERKRIRRIGLCLVLTIVAFIVALLVGLLVYFLFMLNTPKHRNTPGVEGSVRILNMTYNDDMANTSSQAFFDIARPFCAELDSYISRSNYSHLYDGCRVIALRNVADVTDCLCLGTKKGSVMVNFQLHFNGSHEQSKLRNDIYDIIHNSVTKLQFQDVIYVLLKRFLVDIRFDWDMPFDAIAADVTLPVYNLNYTQELANNQSKAFQQIARPFCDDVDGILSNDKLSWLAPRYTSCRVTGFSKKSADKGTVSFTLNFQGHDPRPLQQGLLYILLNGARNVKWYGQLLKMIGTLVITPFGATNHLRPVNITRPPPNLTYISVSLPVFNLTLTPDLGDPRSPYFINISTHFCRDMTKFYGQSSLKDTFYTCKVLGFRPNQTRLEVQLGFKADPWLEWDKSVAMVIRAHAPDRIYATLHLYTVGPLEVILDHIAANGLELHTSLRVVNLTFVSALEDTESSEFLHHAVLFCRDLENFYRKSGYANRFLHCGVKAFSPRPVSVHFVLIFKGTQLNGLTLSHIDVIRRHAKEVFLNSEWIAYLVGDLLVLPERLGHSVYPTNITHSVTATVMSSTDVIVTSTITPAGEMAKATITGHLYNFTFDVDLMNPGSERFKSLENHFCNDVNRVYHNSFLFLTYRGCKIDRFRSSPNQVVFSLYFDAQVSRDLEWSIRHVLINESPKVILSISDHKQVEVLHLGDLYLTLRDIILQPTASTSLPIGPTQTQTMMSSTLPPSLTSSIDFVTSTVTLPTGSELTLRYPLFNFTYVPGLGDPTFQVFKHHQRLLCLEIQEVFKASPLFYQLYDGCSISHFGIDEHGFPYVEFHLHFNTGLPDPLLTKAVDTLEKSRAHLNVTVNGTSVLEILPIYLLLILENRTTSSSIISSSMTQTRAPSDISTLVDNSAFVTSAIYGGVLVILFYETYDLGYTSDLEQPNSPRFLAHRQKVCRDLEKWYSGLDSPFYTTYHGCDLTSFSSNPEGVTFTLTLRADMTSDIARQVRTYLEYKAPKRFVPGFNLLQVGDLNLIVDRYTIDIRPIPWPSDSYMTSTIEPTSTLVIWPSSSTYIPTETMVSLKFGLADFLFTEELNYDISQRYRFLQDGFCVDIARVYSESPLRPYYTGCKIEEFTKSPPNQPNKMTFTVMMEMTYNQDLVDLIIETLLAQEPQILRDGYVTIKVGELYLILKDWSNVSPPDTSQTFPLPTLTPAFTYTETSPITSVSATIQPSATSSTLQPSSIIVTTQPTTTEDPNYYFRMSFEVVNMTWTPELDVNTSYFFRRHNKLFCDELNQFLPGHSDKDFQHYIACNIDSFSGQPLRVNFSLQFQTLHDLDLVRIQRLVIQMIKEYAIRHTVGNLMVFQVGDILIDIDSVYIHNDTRITTVNIFDAISFEHRYAMLPSNFSRALLDKSSYEFRSRAYQFCQEINSIFASVGIRNIRQRYMGCYVNEFRNGPSPSVIFTIVFNGTEDIDAERLNGIIVFSKQTEGVTYFTIGDLLVTSTPEVQRHFLMLDMWSTHPYPYTTVPTPAVYTYVEIKLQVVSPSWREELRDPASDYYQQMAKAFCDDVDRWIKAEKPDYLGCEILRFGNNPMTIEADLKFIGEQSASLRMDVDTILLESPEWDILDNVIFFKIGQFFIFEESLVLDQRTVPANSTTTSSSRLSITPTTSPTPTRPSNPCLSGGTGINRHPTLCDRFIQCVGDAVIEIPCGPGSVYLDNVCTVPPKGFQCTALPG